MLANHPSAVTSTVGGVTSVKSKVPPSSSSTPSPAPPQTTALPLSSSQAVAAGISVGCQTDPSKPGVSIVTNNVGTQVEKEDKPIISQITSSNKESQTDKVNIEDTAEVETEIKPDIEPMEEDEVVSDDKDDGVMDSQPDHEDTTSTSRRPASDGKQDISLPLKRPLEDDVNDDIPPSKIPREEMVVPVEDTVMATEKSVQSKDDGSQEITSQDENHDTKCETPSTSIVTPPTDIDPPIITAIPCTQPTPVIAPPTPIIDPPTSVIASPTPVIPPPTTAIAPPTTVIAPPTAVIAPPTAVTAPPTAVIALPNTAPTTAIATPSNVNTVSSTTIVPPSTAVTLSTTSLTLVSDNNMTSSSQASISSLQTVPPISSVADIQPPSTCNDGTASVSSNIHLPPSLRTSITHSTAPVVSTLPVVLPSVLTPPVAITLAKPGILTRPVTLTTPSTQAMFVQSYSALPNSKPSSTTPVTTSIIPVVAQCTSSSLPDVTPGLLQSKDSDSHTSMLSSSFIPVPVLPPKVESVGVIPLPIKSSTEVEVISQSLLPSSSETQSRNVIPVPLSVSNTLLVSGTKPVSIDEDMFITGVSQPDSASTITAGEDHLLPSPMEVIPAVSDNNQLTSGSQQAKLDDQKQIISTGSSDLFDLLKLSSSSTIADVVYSVHVSSIPLLNTLNSSEHNQNKPTPSLSLPLPPSLPSIYGVVGSQSLSLVSSQPQLSAITVPPPSVQSIFSFPNPLVSNAVKDSLSESSSLAGTPIDEGDLLATVTSELGVESIDPSLLNMTDLLNFLPSDDVTLEDLAVTGGEISTDMVVLQEGIGGGEQTPLEFGLPPHGDGAVDEKLDSLGGSGLVASAESLLEDVPLEIKDTVEAILKSQSNLDKI